ncbi:MAG: hypothetical protein K940chlam7_02111, partial [Chlamydiae bacterium]|nr:hypothetical protein [Chlamydiota bacterium]
LEVGRRILFSHEYYLHHEFAVGICHPKKERLKNHIRRAQRSGSELQFQFERTWIKLELEL